MTVATATPAKNGADLRSVISGEAWGVEELLERIRQAPPELSPFDDVAIDLCAAVANELLGMRQHPEAVSLGFWMRPASTRRMAARFFASESDEVIHVPRGLAFHVTPANVDTIFVYSWILSLLVGNSNIVRLSARPSQTRDRIMDVIGNVLKEPRFEGLARRNVFVLTDHDERVSSALCADADVRVVWGGDATVQSFRRLPMPTWGREIVFPNRHSMAILDAAAINDLDEVGLSELADRFFNDAYWFDQGACSSPRLIIWRDSGSALARSARERFHAAVVAATRRRGYQAETGMALNKMAFAMERAASGAATRIESASNEAMWVDLSDLSAYDRENCGGGLFFEYSSTDLATDLGRLVNAQDQTAACFGIDPAAVRSLARQLNGKGIDRFVSVGQALEFESLWDGSDLLQELSRRVVVRIALDPRRPEEDEGSER